MYSGVVMPGWQAGSGVGKYCTFVQCRELQTGQQKVQLNYKDEDDPLCPSWYIICLGVCGSVWGCVQNPTAKDK